MSGGRPLGTRDPARRTFVGAIASIDFDPTVTTFTVSATNDGKLAGAEEVSA